VKDNDSDAQLGMAWWNGMSVLERAEALRAANTDIPAEAWRHWQTMQFEKTKGTNLPVGSAPEKNPMMPQGPLAQPRGRTR
jgi:hypothetical protein